MKNADESQFEYAVAKLEDRSKSILDYLVALPANILNAAVETIP